MKKSKSHFKKSKNEYNDASVSEVRELKGQINKLTKEVSRLRKELNKFKNLATEEELIVEALESLGSSDELFCPEGCQTPLRLVQLGPKTLLVCETCKYRKIKK